MKRRRFFRLIPFACLILVYGFLKLFPLPELREAREGPYSGIVTDRFGVPLTVVPLDQGLRREYLPVRSLPTELKRIILLSEDKRFLYHPGVDPFALSRSIWEGITSGEFHSGAATITMQTARLIYPAGQALSRNRSLRSKKSLQSKLREMLIAMCLEARIPKDKILELYINRLPFGNQVEGLQSAARFFFGKPATELTPGEMCLLITIPRNPSRYGGNSEGRAGLIQSAVALAQKAGIDIDRREDIPRLAESLSGRAFPFSAPHFINYVKAGWPEALSKGKTLKTSLDLNLNAYIEERLRYYLASYEQNRLTNGAVLVVDNKTAEILAYVGSRNFFDTDRPGQIDGVRITNQPGSCLKPFLYALALDKGYRPNTVLPDLPLDLGGPQVYVPMNFNNKFHGPVRLRTALASSLNVPAVFIVSKLGADNFARFLTYLGFDSIESQRGMLGEGIVLGSVDVSLLELVQAFSIFPRGGVFLPVIPSAAEECLKVQKVGTKKAVSPYAAALICDILSDRESRVTGFGPNPVFNTPFPSMFKTGTANQFQHIWALGATQEYTVGVWLGNFTGETVIGSTGSSVPAALAVDILKIMGDKGRPFKMADNTHKVEICLLSGEKAGPACINTGIEYLPNGEDPIPCTYHRFDRGEIVTTYPEPFARRAALRGSDALIAGPVGTRGRLTITHPTQGAVFYMDPGTREEDQGIRITIEGPDLGLAVVSVNGVPVDGIKYPYSYFFQLKPGIWVISVAPGDETGGEDDGASVRFEVKP